VWSIIWVLTNKDGIVFTPSQLDFSTLVARKADDKVLDLQLFNGSPEIVEVLEISTADKNVLIDFYPSIVSPLSYLYIAQVSFNGKLPRV
jgi:hypothetical protein